MSADENVKSLLSSSQPWTLESWLSKVSVISQQMRYSALSAQPCFGCYLVYNDIFIILAQAKSEFNTLISSKCKDFCLFVSIDSRLLVKFHDALESCGEKHHMDILIQLPLAGCSSCPSSH